MATNEESKLARPRTDPAITESGFEAQPIAAAQTVAEGEEISGPGCRNKERFPDGTQEQSAFATQSSSFLEIIWDSAGRAFISTILVIVLGSVAIGLVSGIWRQMTPSLSPGFAPAPAAEAEAPARPGPWTTLFHEHRFLILFGLIFAVRVYSRVATLPNPEVTALQPRLRRIGRRLSEDWFGLVVGNAFGAMISAIALVWLQQFSSRWWFYHWLAGPVLSTIQDFANHLLGGVGVGKIQAWIAWYGANQFKFTFWCFYVAAVCDDLGIPNLKTLGRWLWRKWFRRLKETAA